MSEPPPPPPPQPQQHQTPTSSAIALLEVPAQQRQQPPREYRKGNWTVQETLTLITAKRLDDERRRPSSTPSAPSMTPPRSAEQRWKWVENYCWAHDCLRSQNQCNDKWDNLLRDYKKVRDYQHRSLSSSDDDPHPPPSYWSLDRHQRKERNLPTNLSFDVYEALADVLCRRSARRGIASSSPTAASPPPAPSLPPPPQPPLPPTTARAAEPSAEPSVSAEASESDESGSGEPGTKRRKLRSLGSSVVRGASVLARTLTACEEKREQRHRERLGLEERRVKLEEERAEMNRQAVSGLISAVNGLSTAIHALASGHRDGDGSHV